MYNAERKNNFLAETRNSRKYGESIFKTMAACEERHGKDLCLLPADILQEFINKNFGVSTRATERLITFLNLYCNWCKEKGFDVIGGTDGLEVQTAEKIRYMMVSSPKHLEIVLDKAFDAVEKETIDCLYRCFFWMAFAGIRDSNALEVKADEVDFDAFLINHDGKSYELYREAVPAFRNACTLTEFVHIHPGYKNNIKRARASGDYLIRGIKAPNFNLNAFRATVGKRFRERGIEVTYSRIRLSGIFYRAYEIERAGLQPDFSADVNERLTRIDRNYSTNYTREKVANGIERDLLSDYENWKKAFE